MADDFERLPARVKAVINRCRNGERLQKTLIHKETGNTEIVFTYEPSGKRAGPKSAEQAIAGGHLMSAGDGLFDESTSQTFTA